MNNIDWENTLQEVLSEVQGTQLAKVVFEKTVLDAVNRLVVPTHVLLRPDYALLAATELINAYGQENDFVPVIDGILFRTSGIRQEALGWALKSELTRDEMKRRADVVKGITYRRQVLRQAFYIKTNEEWSTKGRSTPAEFIAEMKKIEEDAATKQFEDDYSDALF